MDTIRFPQLAIFLVLLSFTFLGLRHAEAQFFQTSNNFVEADVSNDGHGFITIFDFDASHNKQRLTYTDFSFLTVQVGSDFFTNNSFGPTIVEPGSATVTPTLLSNGVTALVKDTIRTTWQPKGPNAFDIVQDVYPVAGVSAGQIVYKWSIVNRGATGLSALAQFMLDLETSNDSESNDDPKITTREGYNESNGSDFWHNFTSLPPYFITSEFDICTKNFPGVLGAGFTDDILAPFPMGLLRPSLMANVDLKQYVLTFVMGFPSNMDGTPMSNDNALIFQWPSTGVFGAINGKPTVQELGRGCYGTPPCTPITIGNLDALLLHTDHVKWNGSMYVPNHFPVEAILWGPNTGASGAVATESITNSISAQHSGPVQVLPTSFADGGYAQSHAVQSGGSSRADSLVPACGMGFVTWEDTVLASVLTNCSTDSSYDITLSVSAANVQQPIFPFGLPVCPVIVDCQEKDFTPPRHSQHIFSDTNHCGNPMTFKDSVLDNLALDQGIQSITFTVIPNPTAIKITVPAFSGCPAVVGPITSTQVDTLAASCIFFTYTDCAGNVSFDTVCFAACPSAGEFTPIIIADDIDFGNVLVGDTVCKFLTIRNVGNASLVITQNWLLLDNTDFSFPGSNQLPDTIPPSDSMSFQICFHPQASGAIQSKIDWGTNLSPVYAHDIKDTSSLSGNGAAGTVNSASSNLPFSLSISPNPTSGSAMISLTGAPSANVEIFDVLGREVASFHITGSYEWQMGALPGGTYIVRASIGDAVVSKQMLKE